MNSFMLPLSVLNWQGVSWEAQIFAKQAYGAFSLWLNVDAERNTC